MGLYLCVFAAADADDEVDGVDVGSYEDFNQFRATVAEHLEGGVWASRFPVLMSHDDSDGEWPPQSADQLIRELQTIQEELMVLPPRDVRSDSWQGEVLEKRGLGPNSLAECFFDIDGEPLLGRLRGLAEIAVRHHSPISFQ